MLGDLGKKEKEEVGRFYNLPVYNLPDKMRDYLIGLAGEEGADEAIRNFMGLFQDDQSKQVNPNEQGHEEDGEILRDPETIVEA